MHNDIEKRGGKRTGAGRKAIAKVNRKKASSIMLSSENSEWINEEVMRTNSMRSKIVNDAINVVRGRSVAFTGT